MTTLLLIKLVILAMSAWTAIAPNRGPDPMRGGDRPPMRGSGMRGNALLAALDANGDGIIDAEEIQNAPAALLKLDANGDGQLTPDEYLVTRSERPDGSPRPPGRNFQRKAPPSSPPPPQAQSY